MSRPRPPEPGIRVVSILLGRDVDPKEVLQVVGTALGPVAAASEEVPFVHTGYYEAEMGPGMRRLFVGLAGAFDPDGLADLKLSSNDLEERWLHEGRRRVNLDPGFLGLAQLVLASGKPAGHRVYLGRGIYGEVELVFAAGTFHPLPWTYPDYRGPAAIDFFNRLRLEHRKARKGSG